MITTTINKININRQFMTKSGRKLKLQVKKKDDIVTKVSHLRNLEVISWCYAVKHVVKIIKVLRLCLHINVFTSYKIFPKIHKLFFSVIYDLKNKLIFSLYHSILICLVKLLYLHFPKFYLDLVKLYIHLSNINKTPSTNFDKAKVVKQAFLKLNIER